MDTLTQIILPSTEDLSEVLQGEHLHVLGTLRQSTLNIILRRSLSISNVLIQILSKEPGFLVLHGPQRFHSD
jgi:hypothetical protein